MRREPVITNPCMSKERIIQINADFTDYINGDKPIPEQYLVTDHERKFAANDPASIELLQVYEHYKNGPKDLDPNNMVIKNFKEILAAQPSA